MNDQWSGKTLRTCFLDAVAMPVRSSAHSATAPTLDGLVTLAACLCAHLVLSRSQKLGPTGSVKSLVAMR